MGILFFAKISKNLNLFFSVVKNYTGGFDFGLGGNGELIRLYDNSGALIDSLSYGDSDPWPKGPDGFGPTLELKNPALDNAHGSNWKTSDNHGTPGSQNSGYIRATVPQPLAIPSNYILTQNYPNPFNSMTTISFEIPEISTITLSIYNLLGQFVQTVFTEELPAGKYSVSWDAGKLSGGVYFYKLNAGNYSKTLKCLLVK